MCGATATIFTAEKFCENLILEDNFNNTLLKTCPSETLLCLGIVTKLIKKC